MLRVGIVLVTACGVFLALLRLTSRQWLPTFDNALIWLRALDVGTRSSPLVGPYSRFGWDHPGPAVYYVLAGPLRLLAGKPTGLLVGALLIGMLCASAAARFTFRNLGARSGMCIASGLAILSWGLSDRLISPWNPFVLVLPFALYIVCCWTWALGRDEALPLLALAGAFCVQCHVGTTLVALTVFAVAAALRVATRTPWNARFVWLSGALTLGVWAPPLGQQVFGNQGNLGALARFFLQQQGQQLPKLGFSLGLRTAATELLPWGSWIGRDQLGFLGDIEPSSFAAVFLPVVSLAASAAFAARVRDIALLKLALIVLAGVIGCFYSFAEIRGPALAYLAVWTRVLAMLCVLTPSMALLRALWGERHASREALLVTLCALLGAQATAASFAPSPDSAASQTHLRFANVIQRTVKPGTPLRVIATGTPFSVSPEAVAIMVLRHGGTPFLQPWEARVPGAHRSVAASAQLPTLALASGPAIEELAERPGARLLEIYDPVTASTRADARALRDLLTQQLTAGHREDLISALRDGQPWLALKEVPGVSADQLRRYLELAGGDAKRAYALFMFAAGPW